MISCDNEATLVTRQRSTQSIDSREKASQSFRRFGLPFQVLGVLSLQKASHEMREEATSISAEPEFLPVPRQAPRAANSHYNLEKCRQSQNHAVSSRQAEGWRSLSLCGSKQGGARLVANAQVTINKIPSRWRVRKG